MPLKTNPTRANLMTITELEKFAAKIVRDENDCWNWTGTITTFGYGEYRRKPVVRALTHRMVLELIHKDITGVIPDHLCENTICCNPAHLALGTQADNVLRGKSPQAVNARKTHCIRGHELVPENTYSRPGTNWRQCRVCYRIYDSKRRKRGSNV